METYSVRTTAGGTALPTTMRAIVQEQYGGPEQLALREIRVPTPAAREVLVRVHAAGVDRGTEHLMTGLPLFARVGIGLRRPKWPTPGRDVAGTVAAVGTDVSGFAVGDEVIGTADGSFAEYAVVPLRRLARKPAGLSFAEAAVLSISGLTALKAVRDVGRVHAGQQVLVTGASGGVGSYAVQMATAAGAEVTGVTSAAKADLVRSLGATRTLDYALAGRDDDGRRYDVIVDCAGNAPLRDQRRLLTPRGTHLLVGGEQSDGRFLAGFERQLIAPVLSLFVRQRVAGVMSRETAEGMADLVAMVEEGSLRAPLDRTFPLEQAADALRYLASGRVRGKIAVVVDGRAG